MSSLAPSTALPSVYDEREYPEEKFQAELSRVHAATAIERLWIAQAELLAYTTDAEILEDVQAGVLSRVHGDGSFVVRQMLRDWTPERSDPQHQFHYSPPFLRVGALKILERVAAAWQEEMGNSRLLSVTSLVRSAPYQRRIANMPRKITIQDEDELSSHQVGLAFDFDSQGIVQTQNDGSLRPINPRAPGFQPTLIAESREVLRWLLDREMHEGQINYVEELPGTQNGCFHVCANPLTGM